MPYQHKGMDGLRVSNGKTEFILSGSKSQLTKCTTEVVDVNGTEVPRSGSICYLGVWFDQYICLLKVTKQRSALLLC